MITDRVGDFIIRLKNAARIGARDVSVPYSALLMHIAKKLKTIGFLSDVTVKDRSEDGIKKSLIVTLTYTDDGMPRLHDVKRLSKPGRRVYMPHRAVHRIRGGIGSRLISTSSGIMSDAEARAQNVGGEALFEIW